MLLLAAAFALVFWLTFRLALPLQEWLNAGVGQLRVLVLSQLTGAPAWLAALLADGVLGGAGVVLTFLPILVVFFAALGLLEG